MLVSDEVSVRDLRNHTKQVIEQIESGATMYLTKHGERIATITSLRAPTWSDVVDGVLDGDPYDSGLVALLAEADAESAAFDDHLPSR